MAAHCESNSKRKPIRVRVRVRLIARCRLYNVTKMLGRQFDSAPAPFSSHRDENDRKRPNAYEVGRCRQWLDFERALVKPARDRRYGRAGDSWG